ncbi:hypothetical protein ACHAXM_011678 [Skeletonema potamos]|jgi:hypothetical protein
MDDTRTKTEGDQSPPDDNDPRKKQQQRRGKPSKKYGRDNSHDVLYLKGAASQQTTHPGNLNYYALCEERFDEWSVLDCDDPKRKQICIEIVKIILQRGGVFHKASGGAMDIKAAVEKTSSRFRQIAKPKLRPHTGMYGENDVVFVRGARNHMYPGNAKWRTLLDGYAQRYHREMKKLDEQCKSFYPAQTRPEYMNEVVEETVSIIKSRGGRFLDEKLKPLSHDVIIVKTHARFKDMKKEIKTGKLVFNVTKNELTEDKFSGEAEAVAADTSASVKVPTRVLVTPGFTSVKATVSSKEERQRKIAKNHRLKEKKFYGNQHRDPYENILAAINIPSIPSDESEVKENDVAADNDDEGKDEEEFKDLSRYERRKRRESGQPALPRPNHQKKNSKQKTEKKRKRTNQSKKERARSPSPEHTLSEYEQMRLAKMERNQKRLKDLGLG